MYRFHLPAQPLQPFIESYWFARASAMTLDESVFVDGKADMLFNFGVGYQRQYLDTSGYRETLTISNLDAQRTYPLTIHQQGSIDLVGVRFRAGGLSAFLPIPLNELTNLAIDVRQGFGPGIHDLEGRLFDAAGQTREQARLLDSFFLSRARQTLPYMVARFVASQIETAGGKINIRQLSREAGYSIRSVDRFFRQHYGLPPKFYARLTRFQRVLHILSHHPSITLTEVALACGYYDQPHFTHEFNQFTGAKPEVYRAHLLAKAAAPPPNLVHFLQDRLTSADYDTNISSI
jgi:AraC-like DNA-binding protein